MDKDEIYRALLEFISDEVRDESVEIKRESAIENDLGISGDDADDFILKFAKKFNVDISEFDADKYFEGEPGFLPLSSAAEKKGLTVEDLERAIHIGRLV